MRGSWEDPQRIPTGSPQVSELPDPGCRSPLIGKSRVARAEVLSETRSN
jgi:hypothetical protein